MTPTELIEIIEGQGLAYQGTMSCLPEMGRVSVQGWCNDSTRVELQVDAITDDVWRGSVWVFARPLYVECLGRQLDRWKVVHGWHRERAPDGMSFTGPAEIVMRKLAQWAKQNAHMHV